MSTTRTIVVFGSGPGIGNHTAAEFATRGFNHVILLARNEQRLKHEDATYIAKASSNVKVDTIRVDLSDLSSIPEVLKEIDGRVQDEDLEVVFFNAARIQPGGVLDVPYEDIHEDFKTTNLALYIVAQWAIPRLQNLKKSKPSSKPSLFVTNSHLPWDPIPQLLSLSLTKASQRNMVQSFNRAFSADGVHAGLITVEGQVSVDHATLNPKSIAEKAYSFYEAGDGLEVKIQ